MTTRHLRWVTCSPTRCLVKAPHLRENLREPGRVWRCRVGPEDSGNLQHTAERRVTTSKLTIGFERLPVGSPADVCRPADFSTPPPSPLIEDVSVAAICCSVALLKVFPSQSLETPLHSSLNLPAADSDMVAHNKTSGHKSAINVSFHKHPFIPFVIKSCSPLFPPPQRTFLCCFVQ